MDAPHESSTASGADYSVPGMRIAIRDVPGAGLHDVVGEIRMARPLDDWVVDERLSHIKPTTLRYRGAYYRIAGREDRAGETVYRVAPWPEQDRVYRLVELTPEAFAAAAEERRADRSMRMKRRAAPLMVLWAGWLPGRWQHNFSLAWDFDADRATLIGGALAFFIGVNLGILATFTRNPIIMLAGVFFMLDGMARMGASVVGDHPLGPIPFELLDWLARGLDMDPPYAYLAEDDDARADKRGG